MFPNASTIDSPASTTEWPPAPQTPAETGLDVGLLLDLCLKTLYYGGHPTARLLGRRMALPFPVVDELLSVLRKQQLAEIVGAAGLSEVDYQYALTSKGME